MAFGLNKVFNKEKAGKEKESTDVFEVKEAASLSLRQSREAFYRHLYPKSTEAPLTIPQKLVLDVLKDELQEQSLRRKAVPRLPSVIPKLLRSLRDPDSSVKDYVEIVNKDPTMSAAVLKLANSVYFNPIGKRIDDIERAVVKLGLDGMRSVLSAAVMQPIIQRDSAYFTQAGQKIWMHSLNCAVACELIAEHRNVEKFKVYIMGLVHDIGKITIFSELCKQFQHNGEAVKPGYNAFVPLMKKMSAAVSYWVAKDWELPPEICKALAEQATLQPGSKVSLYAHILYQANLACETYATVRSQNENVAIAVLESLNLPHDLYDNLDKVARDI